MKKKYYVYLLASKRNGTLYVGITNTLKRRAYEHRNGLYDGYTKTYRVKKLVYFEEYEFVDDAILREKRIKKWKRNWKVRLIEEMNPDWIDLYDELPNF